jgi:hypothetical protein
MDLNFALTILGLLGTAVGLGMAWYAVRRDKRRRLLAYSVSEPLQLASVLPDQASHRITILYERESGTPVNIKGAYVYFVQIANLGLDPIRDADLLADDQLRIEVSGTELLDVALASTTRKVLSVSLGDFHASTAGTAVVPVGFTFLDSGDGISIRLLVENRATAVSLLGTVVGLPDGPREVSFQNSFYEGRLYASCLGVPVMMCTMFGGYYLMGDYVLRFEQPLRGILFFAVPMIATMLASAAVVRLSKAMVLTFPKQLRLPGWYVREYRRMHRLDDD